VTFRLPAAERNETITFVIDGIQVSSGSVGEGYTQDSGGYLVATSTSMRADDVIGGCLGQNAQSAWMTKGVHEAQVLGSSGGVVASGSYTVTK